MTGAKGLSGKLTLALAALLCLLFCLSLLLFFPGGASPEPEIRAVEALPERTLTGGDEADRLPTELLPGEMLDLNTATAAQLRPLPKCGGAAAGPRHRREASGCHPGACYRGIRRDRLGEEKKDQEEDLFLIFFAFFQAPGEGTGQGTGGAVPGAQNSFKSFFSRTTSKVAFSLMGEWASR